MVDQVQESVETEPYVAPPLRTFRVTYTSGHTREFIAHKADPFSGHLIFVDEVFEAGKGPRLYFRKVVAAGQWREYEEISSQPPNPSVH